jgi:phospholipid/cholesterol/gamma-HCH transport system substrate-binding protein
MKRAAASFVILAAAVVFVFVSTGASNGPSGDPSYNIEFQNAFGLVNGATFKVDGIPAGTITSIDLDEQTLNAKVTVQVTTAGLGAFHQSATCASRPQSLIGEYFVSCDPGKSGPLLASGATIPVTHTTSTIPADLLLDINRLPVRERLSLIINELGAAVAGRSGDLQAALARAVPALTETDNLLHLLADDSQTLEALTANSNTVITALANNSTQVQRFITYANNAADDTAVQQANLQSSLQKFPGLLEQLQPAMKKLGAASQANLPVLQNLNDASGELDRFLTDLPGFAHASIPALKSLGKASVTGRVAVQAAGPTVADLNHFAKNTPDLAQNLSIVLPDLDNRNRATETNSRSPGGKGYTGLEALLQFVFNLAGATNTYGPFGHELAVDAFVNDTCTAYASPQTIALNLASNGASYRQCYSWLGPNQPGINETDPSDPTACVPDPGGAPPGEKGPTTSACKLTAAMVLAENALRAHRSGHSSGGKGSSVSVPGVTTPSSSGGGSSGVKQTVNGLGQTINKIVNLLGGGGSSSSSRSGSGSGGGSGSGATGGSGNQTQQLLNYLLSP